MARFQVIPKGGGNAKYSGTPTFTGTYMKPGMLEFREIASPVPIDWAAGDYVAYSRTGLTYRLYNVPQLKKMASREGYGGAFVYQGVQFFDDSKQLEICPFRDLVTGDNRIHFSTQPSISTFEGVDGLARRFQACLDDMFPNTWYVRLATVAMGASQEVVDLMSEARDFTVSGVSILGALERVYEIWPEIGWVFTREQVTVNGSNVLRNVLTIGGGGISSTASYLYGKGNGLTAITRTVANADELANRLFVYGSSRNMLPGWYNSQAIKDAASVDIRNIMLPIDPVGTQGQPGYYPGWGKTMDGGVNKPDPAKAYAEDQASITALGLRPKTYYFDGSGDLPEIYPTVRNVTIAEVRASNPDYVPSSSIYPDGNVRVDKILSAPVPTDDGMAGDSGKSSILSETDLISDTDSGTISPAIPVAIKAYLDPFYSKTVTIPDAGTFSLRLNCQLSGTVTTMIGYAGIVLRAYKVDGSTETLIGEREARLGQATPDSSVWTVGVTTLSVQKSTFLANQTVRFEARFVLAKPQPTTSTAYTYSVEGTASTSASFYRANTFTVNLRQIGFDIEKYAALGDGKTLAMRSGKCEGRTFQILSSSYVSTTDSWTLELSRSEDESLSQWFPNSNFPIESGDEFVLLDIAMPEEYVKIAELRLLQAAQNLLLDTATERWQYVPEIDAKFMIETGRTIVAGQNMTLQDADIIGQSPVAVIVDSLTINEGDSTIPTYKVTLRDRKRITFTESESAPAIQSKPVTSITESPQTYNGATEFQNSYFELDGDGNITLKSPYQNLWVPGWLAAGGVGTGGGGGGGGTNVSWGVQSGYTIPLIVEGNSKTLLLDGALNGYALASSVPTALSQLSADANHRLVTDAQILAWDSKGGVSSITLSSGTGITVSNSGVAITDQGSRTISISTTYQNRINHGETAYGWGDHSQAGYLKSYTESDPTVPAWAKETNLQFSALPEMWIGSSRVQSSSGAQALTGISSIKATVASNSETASMVVWEPNAGGTGIGAWHFRGNVYADGWIAAGGVGSGSGGGGGTDLDRVWESLTNNTDKPNVKINVAHIPDITTAKISDLESWISAKGYITAADIPTESTVAGWGFTKNAGTVTSVTLTQGTGISITNSGTAITTSGTRTISITSTYRNYITHGEEAYSWGDHRLMGYLTQHQDISGYALKTGGSDYQFLVSQLKFSNGYLSGGSYNSVARPQWTYGSTTKNLAYLDEIPTSLKNPYSLTFGSKTYDGSANRTILASDLGAVTSSDVSSMLSGYLPLTGGTLTGDLRLKNSGNYGMTLRFGDGDYSYIKEDTDDHLTLYASKGITLSTGSSYGIQFGDGVLKWDATNNAWHLVGNFYADGWVAAGGIGGANSMFVTISGTQTITGSKTFTGTTVVNGLTVTKDSSDYVTLSTPYRMYIQDGGKDVCLTPSGHTIIGSYPGSSAVGSNKLYVGGTAIATTWNTSSDRRLKEDISYLVEAEAIEKLMRLKPATWKWNSGLAKGHTASGFIAQEVEPVIPFMVTGEDYKSLAYQMLHAYEVSALKSHEERLRALEKKMKITEG